MPRVLGYEFDGKNFTRIVAWGKDNICHDYAIGRTGKNLKTPMAEFASIHFQDGPIKEASVNGCQNEDIIAIVIDRLRGFQVGKLACNENAIALGYLEQTLYQLNKRTEDRTKRGVEGTSKI